MEAVRAARPGVSVSSATADAGLPGGTLGASTDPRSLSRKVVRSMPGFYLDRELLRRPRPRRAAGPAARPAGLRRLLFAVRGLLATGLR
jgi:hypothetical protein